MGACGFLSQRGVSLPVWEVCAKCFSEADGGIFRRGSDTLDGLEVLGFGDFDLKSDKEFKYLVSFYPKPWSFTRQAVGAVAEVE